MLLALILSIVGLVAVFDFHNAQKISNLYSLHSWIGIVATALFALQVHDFEQKNSYFMFSVKWLISSSSLSFSTVGGGYGGLPATLVPHITA